LVSLVGLWVLFAAFTLYFFRDPDPVAPSDPKAIVAPGHGKVDVIDETDEPQVMGGRCRRLSIFLSVFDVHVQHAPLSGRVIFFEHRPGKFLSATRAHSAEHNECVLLGLESAERPGLRVGVRLVAGVLARRIVPWVQAGQQVQRSERLSLIQFGSRVELDLPLAAQIQVAPGARVKGGETVVATLP